MFSNGNLIKKMANISSLKPTYLKWERLISIILWQAVAYLCNVLKRMKNLFWDLWPNRHLVEFFFVPKDAQCSETDFLVREFFFEILSLWDMVDFVLDIRWIGQGVRWIHNKFILRGLRDPKPPVRGGFVAPHFSPGAPPPGPGCFWIESP